MNASIITFEDSIEKKDSELIHKITHQKNFSINKDERSEFINLIPFIKEWRLQTLRLDESQRPTILKEISFIKFSCILNLHLDGNKIQTIEGMSKIWFPSIRQLFIGKNQLSSAKELGKCIFPQLNLLRLFNNKIPEFPHFYKMKGSELKYFSLQYNANHPEQSSDLNWIGKIETKLFTYVYLESKMRMKEGLVQKTLKKKFSSVKFFI